tara:strand:- start:361 stop:585 length:225 start_codon:yes stop_codon:yes gene_type:complete
MCLPSSRSRGTSAPRVDPNIAAMRAAEEARERQKAADEKEETLEKRVRRMRGGRGLRSLFTSNRGGLGYYSETL